MHNDLNMPAAVVGVVKYMYRHQENILLLIVVLSPPAEGSAHHRHASLIATTLRSHATRATCTSPPLDETIYR